MTDEKRRLMLKWLEKIEKGLDRLQHRKDEEE